MKILAATRPTNPAAIHSIVSMKRSIDARFISAPHGQGLQGENGGGNVPPPKRKLQSCYWAKASYLASEARSSVIAASGSTPVFLTPSAQSLISGSEAFFHSAVCSAVSL